jgi:hypothetical protein
MDVLYTCTQQLMSLRSRILNLELGPVDIIIIRGLYVLCIIHLLELKC